MKVDLRSDTVTKPSAAMREAMAAAVVGDDVYGEDPTVNELQRRVAELLDKEEALFVPSGTMANQIAIRSQTHHGDEIVMERTCHPFNFESGAIAALSGVQVNLVDGDRGRFLKHYRFVWRYAYILINTSPAFCFKSKGCCQFSPIIHKVVIIITSNL